MKLILSDFPVLQEHKSAHSSEEASVVGGEQERCPLLLHSR